MSRRVMLQLRWRSRPRCLRSPRTSGLIDRGRVGLGAV